MTVRESSGALPDVELAFDPQRHNAEMESLELALFGKLGNTFERMQLQRLRVFVGRYLLTEKELREDLQRVSEERDVANSWWDAASLFIRDVFEACGLPQPAPDSPVNLPALLLQVVGQIEEGKTAEASLSSLTAELQPLIERWKKEAAIEEQMAEHNVSTGHDFAARQRRAEARRLLQCSRELSALLDRSRGTKP